MRFSDATLLITGGASGLGAACTRRFAGLGARVVVADVDAAAGEAVEADVGSPARFVKTDVTSPEEVRAAIELAAQPAGSLRGVIHCAGILAAARVLGRSGPHDLESFRRVIEVNLVGTFNVLRLAADAMAGNEPDRAGQRGVIITTASVAAFEGQVGQAAYSASKGGVASMTLPVARELASHGIRVVAIAPGVFRTSMIEALPDAARQSLEAQTLFPKRLGEPEEYAALAQQILENPMLNASVIRLDGGVRMARK